MPSLADVAPAFKRKTKTLTFESEGEIYTLNITGIKSWQLAEIGERFEGFFEFAQQSSDQLELVKGEETESQVQMQLGLEFFRKFSGAIPAVIATGTGFHGNINEEAIAAEFDEVAQMTLFNEIMSMTNRSTEGDRKALSPLEEPLPNGSALGQEPAP